MAIKSGVKPLVEPAMGKREAALFRKNCSKALHVKPCSLIRLKHFSHFDTQVAQLATMDPTEACGASVVLLGDMQRAGWRGIRPQLASLLLLLAKMARRDGYSIRVVAETALQNAL